MTAPNDGIDARGPLRVEAVPPDEAWIPPVGGSELGRATVVGTGAGTPVLTFAMPDDVDPRRVVVFVRVGTLLCSLAPTRVGDRYEVELPFSLGTHRALVVVLECRSEADAAELVKRYDASRVRLDEEAATGAEPPPEAAPPDEAAAEPEPPTPAPPPAPAPPAAPAPPRVPPMTRSIPPREAAPVEAAPVEAAPPADGGALAFVQAEMPKRVVVETPVEVRFRLSRRRLEASAGTSHTAQSIHVDTGRDVTVTIAVRGFRLADGEADSVSLRLPASADEVAEHRFTIIAPQPGKGEVSLAVRQDADLPLATLRITADIVAAGAPVEVEATEVAAEVVDPDPELVRLPSIRIDESIVGNDSMLRIRVTVAGDARECTKQLPDKAGFIARTYQLVAGLRAELGDIRSVEEKRRHGQRRLRELGMGLARALFTTDVLDLLWNAAPDDLDGLIVQTTGELDIPWEIVHLVPPAGIRDDDKPRFLSGFGLTRWVYDTAHPTELHVEPARVRYVCPEYIEQRLRLTHTAEERRFMEHEFAATTVDPDDAGGITALMHSGFDLLHFAGHGRWSAGSPPAQELLLAGFREAEDVPGARYSDGELRDDLPDVGAADAAATGPFVFLNACDIGRLPSGPAALGGFPEAFLRGGAAAFVGCSWAVGDDPASVFVEAFYRALAVPGTTMADATRTARLAARAEADLSEHAYAVYAHPHAHVLVDRPTLEGPGS